MTSLQAGDLCLTCGAILVHSASTGLQCSSLSESRGLVLLDKLRAHNLITVSEYEERRLQLSEEPAVEEPHWPPNETIDKDLALRVAIDDQETMQRRLADLVNAPVVENPKHLGYDYLEMHKAFAQLECPICLVICLDPMIPLCGHHHCRACLFADARQICSLCRAPWRPEELEDLSGPRHLAQRNLYASVMVRCKACFIEIERGYKGENFEAHIPQCPIACPYCEFETIRANLPAHLTVCPEKPIRCEASDLGCRFIARREAMPQHEASCPVCLLAPILRQNREAILQLTARAEALQTENNRLNAGLQEANNLIRLNSEVTANLSRLVEESRADRQRLGEQTAALVIRIGELEASSPGRIIWSSALPLGGEKPGQGRETADLHLKFDLLVQGQSLMFHLHFEGHLYTPEQPLSFRAVAYVRGKVPYGSTQESGPCKVSRVYTSSDGYLCVVVSAGGVEWHASELAVRLVGVFKDVWRRDTPAKMVIKAVEHRQVDF